MAKSLRILILEDSPADAELIQFELQEAGIIFTPKVVMTENAYVQAIQDYCPDLILSDYDLPRYSGALALAEARKRCPDTPFILVTGAVTEDRAIDILTQGAKDYVLKGRLQQRLVPAVRRALAEAEEHRARKLAEDELREAHKTLEERVKIRTAELEAEMAVRKKTEEALREAYRRTASILESIADAFYSLDKQWRFVAVNLAAERAPLGRPASELLGKVIWNVFPTIVGTRIHQHYIDAMEKGSREHYEAQSPLNGRWYEVFMFPRGRGLDVYMRDITERKRAEEAISQSQKTFYELVERSPFGTYIVDSQFRIAQMNAASQTGAFRNVRPVIGRDFGEAMHTLWPEPVATEIIAAFRHTLDTGEPYYPPRFFNPRNDVTTVEAYEWELHRMSLPDGQHGVVCYYFDSTRLREAEEASRESKALLTRAENIANVGSWEWDMGSGELRWSDQTYRMLGLEPGKLTPTYDLFLASIYHEDRQRVEQAITDTLSGNKPLDLEFRMITSDSSTRWVHSRGEAAFDENVQPSRIQGVIVDITEGKLAESMLQNTLQRFYHMLASMYSGLLLMTDEGRIEFVNQAFCDFYGLKEAPTDLTGLTSRALLDRIKPAFLLSEEAAARIREILQHGQPVRSEEFAMQGGRTAIRDFIPLNINGKSCGRLWIHTDITERKRAEEAQSALLRKLQQMNEEAIRHRILLETVIRQMPIGLVVLDLEGQTIVRNAKAEEMSHEPTYSDFFQRYHGTSKYRREDGTFYKTEDLPAVRALRKGETIVAASMIFNAPDGREVHLSINSAPLLDSEGRIIGSVSIYWDITERKRVEEELCERKRLLQDVIDGSTSPIFLKDVDGKFITINASLERMLGMSREEIRGKTDYDIASKEVADYWRAHDKKVMETGKAIQIEEVADLQDGHHIFVANKFPLMDAKGQVYGVGAISHDITERKQAEEMLRRSEERYRALFNSMTEGFAIHEIITDEQDIPADYRFLDVNRAFEHLTGLRRKDVVGKTHNEVLPGDDPKWLRMYGVVALTGEPMQFENYSPILKRHYSVLAYRPAPRQFAAIFMDITERKNREKEQEKSSRMLRALKKSNQALIQSTDEHAYMEEVCRIVVEDCGHAMVWIGFAEDDEGKMVRPVAYSGFEQGYIDTLKITWADSERGRGPTGTAIREGKACACRNMLTDPVFEPWREEALKRGYASSIVLPLVSDRRVFGALTIYSRDPDPFTEDEVKLLTELASDLSYGIMAMRLRVAHAKAEEALNERTVQLENTNKELESFSYSVSHDLRAPLRAIEGYARMILRQQGDKFDENTRQQFDIIRNNTKMMGQLIDDLLALSRLGRDALSVSRISMEDMTRGVWEELKASNTGKSVNLKIHDIPSGTGDRSLIKQVLINLLSNAIKFTRDREVPLIEVGGTRIETENVYFVRDNGVGFDMQYHDKLFGVFQRLHSATDYEGTGVGLAIVQRIVHRHGGRVWAEGEVDKGATFYFTLPAGQNEESAVPR